MNRPELYDGYDYVNDLTKVLTYFKLIYIEKLTKDKSYDTFRMLGGDDLFETFIMKADPHTLSSTNIEMLDKLYSLINNASEVSLSHIVKVEIEHLDWLGEIEIIPTELVTDTITRYASISVYENKIKDRLTSSYSINSEKKAMVKCKDIIGISKTIK